jgi:hypothetical protein
MYVRSVILFTFLATAGSLLARQDKPADTVDLSTADFSKGNIIDVEGPWEFYWKRFIEPEESRSHPKKESDAVVSGSIAWTDLSVHGEQLGSDGFATYRLKVRLPKDCPQLGLSIAHQFSSYRLFVDHREMARSGMPGTTSESTMHSRKDNTVFFQPTSQDLEIMFHVANFYNYRGGLTGGIQLGSSESIQSNRYRLLAFDLFMIGFVFSIWLYHLFIFVQRPGEKSILFYLVLSGSFLPRMMLLDQKVIFLLVDSVPLNVHIKVLHGLNAITPTLIALFVRSVLPSMVSRRIVILFFLASLPYYATWFLAPQVQTRAVFFYLFFAMAIVVLPTGRIMIGGIRYGTRSAILQSFGILTFILILMLAIILTFRGYRPGYLAMIAFATLAFFQALTLAIAYNEKILLNRRMSERLRESEEALGQQRKVLELNLHDMLGGNLTDLKVYVERMQQKFPLREWPTAIEKLRTKISATMQMFRSQLLFMEDMELASNDLFTGLHMMILRRYTDAGRELVFTINDTSVRHELQTPSVHSSWMHIFFLFQEICTNDLKYGIGESHWSVTHSGDQLVVRQENQVARAKGNPGPEQSKRIGDRVKILRGTLIRQVDGATARIEISIPKATTEGS